MKQNRKQMFTSERWSKILTLRLSGGPIPKSESNQMAIYISTLSLSALMSNFFCQNRKATC